MYMYFVICTWRVEGRQTQWKVTTYNHNGIQYSQKKKKPHVASQAETLQKWHPSSCHENITEHAQSTCQRVKKKVHKQGIMLNWLTQVEHFKLKNWIHHAISPIYLPIKSEKKALRQEKKINCNTINKVLHIASSSLCQNQRRIQQFKIVSSNRVCQNSKKILNRVAPHIVKGSFMVTC